MEDIQNKAVERYQRNMEYLQQHQPHIVKLLSVLEQAIANGDYKELYALDYVDGNFDVQEIQSGNYLYDKQSTFISKELAKKVNFNKEDATLEGVQVVYKKDLSKLSEKEQGYEGIYPLMNYYVENSVLEGLKEFKAIKKYIFLGTGLGLHLPLIAKKVQAKNYLIVEDNLELFKLSLFCTDYQALAKDAKLYFSISDEKESFLEIFSSYLTESFLENRFLKYTHFKAHSDEKIAFMQHRLATHDFMGFPYKSVLRKLIHPLHYLEDGSNFLNLAQKISLKLFEEKPVLLVAAGPSLKKNIEWVAKNKEKFVIVALSATLKLLQKYSIKPDIITHVDGYKTSLVHIEGVDDSMFENTIGVFDSYTPLEVRERFAKEYIFTLDKTTEYFKGFSSVPANCVGSFTFNALLAMNAKQLYLLGLDLALDQESGSTHMQEHTYNNQYDLEQTSSAQQTGLRRTLLRVEGNFTKEVVTTSLFYLSIQSINHFIGMTKSVEQKVYNLSDGAKFTATTPMRCEDVSIEGVLEKENLYALFKEGVKRYSTQKLDQEDRASLLLRLQKAQEIKSMILSYEKQRSNNAQQFLYALTTLYIELLKRQSREENNIVFIYMNYFNYMFPIVSDYFNTKNLKHEKRDVKKLHKMIFSELENIADIYIEALQQFVEKHLQDLKSDEVAL